MIQKALKRFARVVAQNGNKNLYNTIKVDAGCKTGNVISFRCSPIVISQIDDIDSNRSRIINSVLIWYISQFNIENKEPVCYHIPPKDRKYMSLVNK